MGLRHRQAPGGLCRRRSPPTSGDGEARKGRVWPREPGADRTREGPGGRLRLGLVPHLSRGSPGGHRPRGVPTRSAESSWAAGRGWSRLWTWWSGPQHPVRGAGPGTCQGLHPGQQTLHRAVCDVCEHLSKREKDIFTGCLQEETQTAFSLDWGGVSPG